MKEGNVQMIYPCILLIDNDVKLLVKLEAALRQAGYRVLTAHEARQAIYLAKAALPEVIICNPKSSAVRETDVKGTLAKDSKTAAIPFLFMNKPFDKHELVARLNAMIRSQAVH